MWINIPQNVSASRFVLPRWVSITLSGPPTVLALISTWPRPETVKATWEQDRWPLYSSHAWECQWLGVAGLPFTVPQIPLSFLNSSWHVNTVMWFFRYSFFRWFFCYSWRLISQHRSATCKALFSSHPRRKSPQEGAGLFSVLETAHPWIIPLVKGHGVLRFNQRLGSITQEINIWFEYLWKFSVITQSWKAAYHLPNPPSSDDGWWPFAPTMEKRKSAFSAFYQWFLLSFRCCPFTASREDISRNNIF